ncbi:hypothetical protein M0813_20385 [Anaeramoeba flamelloides]|uniref:Uncharacterized protein n=1 Tax=Anaeramoeba flamelloides TaxID=1746091 RepID=A0ABQ8YLF8_9EUKA|nr:hypothetical protein M0813_20385 [Anaeramoeba flamelloides]
MIEEKTNGYTRGVKFSQILEYLKQNSTHQNNEKEQYQSETETETENEKEKEEEDEKEEHSTTQIQIEEEEEQQQQQQQQQQLQLQQQQEQIEIEKQKQKQLVFEQNQNFINVFVENETLFYEDLEFPLNSCCYLEESENSNKMFGSLVKITPMEIVIRFMSMSEVRVLISQLAVGQYHLSQ